MKTATLPVEVPWALEDPGLGEVDGSAWIPDTNAPHVGTVASPSTIEKTLRVSHNRFSPSTDATGWSYGIGVLSPNSTASSTYTADFNLAPGVEITTLSLRCSKTNAADSLSYTLYRLTTTGGADPLGSATLSATGWTTLSISGLSEVVGDTGSGAYEIRVTMNADASGTDVALSYAEITYEMSDYAKSV